jgi:UDPglucose 6-dehydrogenase
MGLDGRIGRKFLHAGPGYGGSCFPKDTLALARTAHDKGAPMRLVEATIDINKIRKQHMADRITAACGGDVKGKTIAILGVTFKPNTDDMRDSVSLDIIPALQAAGAVIRAYDPEGEEEAKKLMTNIIWCKNAYDAMQGADAAAILTEWNEFRALDLDKTKALLKSPILIDLRNIYKPEEMRVAGFAYTSIGRK